MMDKSELNGNKFIQWQRTSRIFIEAAVSIIEEEGMENLTIRKIADRAAYNSATLYNYFESLDEIKFHCSVRYMDEYLEDLGNIDRSKYNSLELYQMIWLAFADNAFTYPKYYFIIFFKDKLRVREKMWTKHHQLYPEEISQHEDYKQMLSTNNLYERSWILMGDVIEEVYLEEEEARTIDEMVVKLFHSLLRDVHDEDLTKNEAMLLFEKYLDYLWPA